ncbi:MAG: FixH family protein [Anaerolineae bacterium]|nr:FixH family protein [Anaerolineae bacterium]
MIISRILSAILLLSLLAALLGGCRATPPAETLTNDIDITIQLDPDPPQIGDAVLLVTIANAQGEPIDDARINVRGDMNHAGMRPVLREVENGQGGVYRIPFEWTMGGDWLLDVEVTLADGTIARRRLNYTVTTDTGALFDDLDRG